MNCSAVGIRTPIALAAHRERCCSPSRAASARSATPLTFRTFSGDLHQLAEWLHAVGITTVAMESTGVYWIPLRDP